MCRSYIVLHTCLHLRLMPAQGRNSDYHRDDSQDDEERAGTVCFKMTPLRIHYSTKKRPRIIASDASDWLAPPTRPCSSGPTRREVRPRSAFSTRPPAPAKRITPQINRMGEAISAIEPSSR